MSVPDSSLIGLVGRLQTDAVEPGVAVGLVVQRHAEGRDTAQTPLAPGVVLVGGRDHQLSFEDLPDPGVLGAAELECLAIRTDHDIGSDICLLRRLFASHRSLETVASRAHGLGKVGDHVHPRPLERGKP